MTDENRIPNQYGGRCRRCSASVPAGQGWAVANGETGKWEVEHRDGECRAAVTAERGGSAIGSDGLDPRCTFRLAGKRCPLAATWYPGPASATEGLCRVHGSLRPGWWSELDPETLLDDIRDDPAGYSRRVYGEPAR